MWFRPLPWEYAVRNLFRRRGRSLLTLAGLALVVFLLLVVVGFVRGLEATLAVSGDPRVVLVHSLGAAENVENSSVPGRTPYDLAYGSGFVQRRYEEGYVSPELYLGTRVRTGGDDEPTLGLLRGVTPAARLVRRQVQVVEGRWPEPREASAPGEVLVGRLAAAKLGRGADALEVGQTLTAEGRAWRVVGRFAAAGSALESELWCPLEDLQLVLKRQDLSLVALTLAPGAEFGDVDEFCKERLDLELQATPETAYYDALQRHYRPVRLLAWLVAGLLAGAGLFAGLNTMYGAVAGRARELATLQALGFVRRAVALSLVQEGAVLAAAGSLAAVVLALLFVNGAAVRFTMGAFTLRIDSIAVAAGCLGGLFLGVAGALPPAVKALRLPVAQGLRAI